MGEISPGWAPRWSIVIALAPLTERPTHPVIEDLTRRSAVTLALRDSLRGAAKVNPKAAIAWVSAGRGFSLGVGGWTAPRWPGALRPGRV
jgi:hypothetical protein